VTEDEHKLIQSTERQHAILWVVGVGVVIMLIVTTALSSAAIVIAGNVRANTEQIARNSDKLRKVETEDRVALRMASYRTCERGQRERAEQQFRAGLTSPSTSARLVKQLGLSPKLIKQVSVAAVRERLPIFDCIPILTGGQATALDTQEQRQYVRRYAAGQLNPAP
jgi:hypothetical protein